MYKVDMGVIHSCECIERAYLHETVSTLWIFFPKLIIVKLLFIRRHKTVHDKESVYKNKNHIRYMHM